MEWYVEITGESYDLEELSKSLNSPELCITKEDKAFTLKSTDFDLIKDENEVRTRTSEILSIINGAARLVIGMRKPLEVGSIVKINEDGNRVFFMRAEDIMISRDSINASIEKADGTVQEFHQADPIPSWIAIAKDDTNVAKALRLFGAQHDWINLYRIYEVIESDVGGIGNITKERWATAKAIRRFKHTANSPDAIGDQARHGRRITPSKDPMTLPEARSLLETLIPSLAPLKKTIT